jgi:hypothetical protein
MFVTLLQFTSAPKSADAGMLHLATAAVSVVPLQALADDGQSGNGDILGTAEVDPDVADMLTSVSL